MENQTTASCGGLGDVFIKAKKVSLNPKTIWPELKEETLSIKDFYTSYLIYLALIPVVCQFLGMTFVGMKIPFAGTMRWSITTGIISSVMSYVMILLGIYILGFIFHKLSSTFDGNATLEDGVKLAGYAYTPYMLAGVLSIIPSLGVLTILFGIYGFYMLFQGITPMTGVDTKKGAYFVVSLVVSFIVSLVMGLVVGCVGGAAMVGSELSNTTVSDDGNLKLPGGVNIDMNEFQKTMEQMQKYAPKGE